MNDRWDIVPLGEIVSFASGGTPSKSNAAYWGGQTPWVSAKDMKAIFLQDSEDHITDVAVREGARLAPAGAVLLLVRGMTLLNDVPICVLRREMAFNQDVKAVTAGPRVAPEFLPYMFLGNKPQLLSMVDLAGHGTGRLNTEELKRYPINLPPLAEQKAIAHILGTLDDKIELNRRMNETLEAMARALFKSWFVDFDPVRVKAEAKASGASPDEELAKLGVTPDIAALFPDSFQDGTPKGWSFKTIGEVAERIAMGPFGSNIKTDNFVEEGVPVIRGGNLVDGFIDKDFVFLTEEKAQELDRSSVTSGDLVFTHRGTLGQVGLIPTQSRFPKYIVSQSQMMLRVNPTVLPAYYVYSHFRFGGGMIDLLSFTNATGVPAIARPSTSLKTLKILVPTSEIVAEYSSVASGLEAQRLCNIRENTMLEGLRDSLLPKLLSGELNVAEVESMTTEVG